MKKTFFTAFSGFALLLVILFTGCQQESVAPQNSPDFKISSRSDLTCGEPCGEITTADLIRSSGPNAGNDVGDVTVQNDGSNLCIMISTITGVTINDAAIYVGDCTLLPIVPGNGNFNEGSFLYQYPSAGFVLSADATCMTLTIPIPAGACYCVSIRMALSGGQAWAQGSSSSLPSCSSNGCNNGRVFTHCTQECEGCEDSFTSACASVDGCDHAITYTFVPAEDGHYKIQGGINGAPGTSYCSGTSSAGLTQTGGPGPALVTTWEGDLVACETYTVTIGWDGTNGSTGNWSAKDDDGVAHGGNIVCDPLLCDNNGYVAGITCPE